MNYSCYKIPNHHIIKAVPSIWSLSLSSSTELLLAWFVKPNSFIIYWNIECTEQNEVPSQFLVNFCWESINFCNIFTSVLLKYKFKLFSYLWKFFYKEEWVNYIPCMPWNKIILIKCNIPFIHRLSSASYNLVTWTKVCEEPYYDKFYFQPSLLCLFYFLHF